MSSTDSSSPTSSIDVSIISLITSIVFNAVLATSLFSLYYILRRYYFKEIFFYNECYKTTSENGLLSPPTNHTRRSTITTYINTQSSNDRQKSQNDEKIQINSPQWINRILIHMYPTPLSNSEDSSSVLIFCKWMTVFFFIVALFMNIIFLPIHLTSNSSSVSSNQITWMNFTFQSIDRNDTFRLTMHLVSMYIVTGFVIAFIFSILYSLAQKSPRVEQRYSNVGLIRGLCSPYDTEEDLKKLYTAIQSDAISYIVFGGYQSTDASRDAQDRFQDDSDLPRRRNYGTLLSHASTQARRAKKVLQTQDMVYSRILHVREHLEANLWKRALNSLNNGGDGTEHTPLMSTMLPCIEVIRLEDDQNAKDTLGHNVWEEDIPIEEDYELSEEEAAVLDSSSSSTPSELLTNERSILQTPSPMESTMSASQTVSGTPEESSQAVMKQDREDSSSSKYKKCRSLILKYLNRLKEMQKVSSRAKPSYAFIVFKDPIAAHVCAKMRPTPLMSKMESMICNVDPTDVNWFNLKMPFWQRTIQIILSNAAMTTITIFWILLVTLVTSLISLDRLTAYIPPFQAVVESSPVIKGLLVGVIPSILVSLLLIVLRLIVGLLSALEGHALQSTLHLQSEKKLTFFLVVNVLIVPTITSSVFSVLQQIIQNPTSIPTLLATSLPKVSLFYFSYILLQAASLPITTLLCIPNLLLRSYHVLKERLTKKISSPRQYQYVINRPVDIDVEQNLAQHVVIAVIGIVYSNLSPLLLLIVVSYFAIWTNTYRIYFKHYPFREKQTVSLMLYQATIQLYTGLIIHQLMMMGIFFSYSCFVQGVFMFILLVLSCLSLQWAMDWKEMISKPTMKELLQMRQQSWQLQGDWHHEPSEFLTDAEKVVREGVPVCLPDRAKGSKEASRSRQNTMIVDDNT